MLLLTVDSKIIKKNHRKIRFEEEMKKMTVIKLEDWAKVDVDEIRKRWVERRREIEEIKKKKTEREKKIEEAKKRKEEKRKRAIRERRCFVCGIFGHMAHYCRNRKEDKGLVQVPKNKFEILNDRVIQRGKESGKEVGKDRREILKEERVKKERETRKKEKKEKTRKVEIEKENKKTEKEEKKQRDFSRGEILRGRYSLVQ